MRSKTIGALVALVACALAIGACGGGSDSGSSSAESSGPATGTITIWARDAQKVFMGKLVDAYNKSHKAQAKLSIIPSAQFVQKFGTAAASRHGARRRVASTSSSSRTSPPRARWTTSPTWRTGCRTTTP